MRLAPPESLRCRESSSDRLDRISPRSESKLVAPLHSQYAARASEHFEYSSGLYSPLSAGMAAITFFVATLSCFSVPIKIPNKNAACSPVISAMAHPPRRFQFCGRNYTPALPKACETKNAKEGPHLHALW